MEPKDKKEWGKNNRNKDSSFLKYILGVRKCSEFISARYEEVIIFLYWEGDEFY